MNIPNLLSTFRLLLIPVFVAVFFREEYGGHAGATMIFLLAGVTDIIDGRIARKFNQITLLGRILDPLADKLMVMTALICCTVSDAVPLWALVLYIVKEVCQGVCGIIFFRKVKDIMPSNILGKAGTFLFYITIASTLIWELTAPVKIAMLSVSLACIFMAFVSYIIRGLTLSRKSYATTGKQDR